MRRRATGAAIAAIALLGVLAAACDSDTTVHTGTGGEGISVTGVGRVSVEPDVAILNLGRRGPGRDGVAREQRRRRGDG